MAGGVLRLLIYYLDDHVSVLQLPAGRQSRDSHVRLPYIVSKLFGRIFCSRTP
jgi:hypothetical protein